MPITFKKATKFDAKLRLGLAGPAGSGKTRTSLAVGSSLVPNAKVAVVDTERGSASKYSDLYEFDVVELESFHPQNCVDAIHAAEEGGYDVIIIDSLSHFWMGKDGELEQVDRIAKRSNSTNTFAAWRDVTPLHHKLVDAIMGSKCHVIVTLRVKTEWVLEPNAQGKMTPRKVGMAPVMKDGVEYEMDVFGDITHNNELVITKSRCDAIAGQTFVKAGADVAEILRDWLKGAKREPVQPPSDLELTSLVDRILSAKQRFEALTNGETEYSNILTAHSLASANEITSSDVAKKVLQEMTARYKAVA
jgi:hypothetical protein